MIVAGAQLDGACVETADDRRDDVVGGEGVRPARVLEAFDGVPLVEDVALRLAEPVQVIDAADPLVDGAIGRVLQLHVERCLHGQAILVELFGAVARFEILAHFFDEIRRD